MASPLLCVCVCVCVCVFGAVAQRNSEADVNPTYFPSTEQYSYCQGSNLASFCADRILPWVRRHYPVVQSPGAVAL